MVQISKRPLLIAAGKVQVSSILVSNGYKNDVDKGIHGCYHAFEIVTVELLLIASDSISSHDLHSWEKTLPVLKIIPWRLCFC